MRETFQYLLLGHLFIAAVGSACVPVRCLKWNCPDVTQAGAGHRLPIRSCIPGAGHRSLTRSCIPDDLYANITSSCKKDVQVSADRNECEIDEGKDINLKCVHELKEEVWLSGWKKDGKEILDKRNKTTLRFKRALADKTGKYSCYVNGSCGYLESEPHHLKITTAVGSACFPVRCLRMNCPNVTQAGAGHCPWIRSCIPGDLYANITPSCKKELKVFPDRNESDIDEGKDINLKCVHELKEEVWLSGWKKDRKEILDKRNMTTLMFKRALAHKTGKYSCYVNGSCGYLESEPHHLKITNNSEILLIVCGISALALVVTMGLVLKYKLKRDNAKHKERMEMRNQAARSGGPNPMGPRI